MSNQLLKGLYAGVSILMFILCFFTYMEWSSETRMYEAVTKRGDPAIAPDSQTTFLIMIILVAIGLISLAGYSSIGEQKREK